MTDLLHVLLDFPTSDYTHLIPSLEKNFVTVSDLLTLDALELAKRAHLPILDLRRFVKHVVDCLQADLTGRTGQIIGNAPGGYDALTSNVETFPHDRNREGENLTSRGQISLLDPTLDSALAGGIATGYVTEITGER